MNIKLALTIFILLAVAFISSRSVTAVHGLTQVTSVVDGDTIKVNIDGKTETIRLLGIDTPETVDPRKPVQCFGKAASDKMKSFVQGKTVILVDDSTQGDRDKYQRLLRYVYLTDSKKTFINGEMVKQGYAFSYKQYLTKMLDKFNRFERYARENSLGLWGSCPLASKAPSIVPKKITITQTPVVQKSIPTQSVQQPLQQTSSGYICNCTKTCPNLSCDEAQFQLNSCGCSVRDGDKDGLACDSQCQ